MYIEYINTSHFGTLIANCNTWCNTHLISTYWMSIECIEYIKTFHFGTLKCKLPNMMQYILNIYLLDAIASLDLGYECQYDLVKQWLYYKTLNVQWIFIECLLNVHWIHIEYTLNTHWIHIDTHWTHIECTLNTHRNIAKHGALHI